MEGRGFAGCVSDLLYLPSGVDGLTGGMVGLEEWRAVKLRSPEVETAPAAFGHRASLQPHHNPRF